ncbi:hypothetical protein AB0B56_22310 [Streptosporangium canum]|uniref:hypothetical protein n=1 Tax=Streptosporangium canum TaxID=324952 RepID=UPI0034444E93
MIVSLNSALEPAEEVAVSAHTDDLLSCALLTSRDARALADALDVLEPSAARAAFAEVLRRAADMGKVSA